VPWAGKSLTEIENCDQLIVIGSDVRKEVPIIGHRIRKSALKGAKVSFINEEIGDYFFDIANYLPGDMIANLLAVIVALKIKLPSSIQEAANAISHKQKHKNLADLLSQKGEKLILLGHIAINHPSASALRYLASIIAKAVDADIGFITEGANSAGAYMTGILPHREIGGSGKDSTGKNTQEIIEDDSGAMVLWNAEPLSDIPDFGIKKSKNRSIIAFTSFVTPEYKSFADIMLPIGTFAETSGTFINCEGRWQSFLGVANPLHQARPGWKVLRVLGNLLNIDHFDYETSQAILSEIQKKLKDMPLKNNSEQFSIKNNFKLTKSPKGSIKAVPMYKIDSILRHSSSLQLTPEAKRSESL
jgi:NADH-quinone oxidoreductase subunit G